MRICDLCSTARAPATVLGLAVGVLAAATAAAAADDGAGHACRHYSGPFTSVTIPPPACKGPLCTRGQLEGGFPGTYEFAASTLEPTPTDGDPSLFSYEGGSRIVTTKGVLIGRDTGHISLDPEGGASPFVTTVHVVDGTLRYQNVTGTFVAAGILDLATGQARGTYTAELCRGRGNLPQP